ncbi:MAG: pantoate--beta-alanine ligase [Gammaproteobacteria bacterium]|jgi:pantoate--beta-alanine ligase
MKRVERVAGLREQVAKWHRDGLRVAFVPTMGNLHDGHLALVDAALGHADRVVVSIFVNPLQFGEGEDFDSYPRTLEDDGRALEAHDASLLFAPSVEEMYPRPHSVQTRVEVPGISDILCGASRPGHFVGVATVVCKLFNMVQPDVALFGEKDYQQLMVIRLMVSDLALPVEIVGCPTVRESDGLAMSSRNGYLTANERSKAPQLHAMLEETKTAMQQGERDYAALETRAAGALASAGFHVDYFSIREARDLSLPDGETRDFVILAAAKLGTPRLIDNIAFSLD